MKKKFMLAIIAIAASLNVNAQIQFSEFKFFMANIYDFSQLQLEVKLAHPIKSVAISTQIYQRYMIDFP